MSRLTSIVFFDSVGAGSNKTLVSKRINTLFTVSEIAASFALNTNRTLKLYFFVSFDPSAPTVAPPEGINILAQLGQVTFLVGDDEQKVLPVQIKGFDKGAYIKIYAVNTDSFAHTIDARVVLEIGKRAWSLW